MDLLKKISTLFLFLLLGSNLLLGQTPNSSKQPRDGFYNRYLHTEKMPISYDHIDEKDVLWEKRIWREIPLNEKQNHSFKNPKKPFINVLLNAVQTGVIHGYSSWSDDFSEELSDLEAKNLGIRIDTVYPCFWTGSYDPFGEGEMQIVKTELNVDDVQRIRLKEVWYFDEESGKMDVRILGVAPIVAHYDDNGNFLNEGPMFWAYYPELRSVLAKEEAVIGGNVAARMTWEDIFEARLFSSYITKQSNIGNNRIKDVYSNKMTALLEANKIKNEHLNFEQGLWSY